METKKENIIGFDFQGWPICKKNIRDILKYLGLELINGKWQIDDSDERLNIFPKKLNDDGMGYGVNEEWITEVDVHMSNEQIPHSFCNIFTEKETPNIQLWLKTKNKIEPFSEVKNLTNNIKMIAKDIKEENNTIYIYCEWFVDYDNTPLQEPYAASISDGKIVSKQSNWFNENEITY